MKMASPRVIVTPRRRGRPAVEEGTPSAYVTLTVPAPEYDQVYEIAQRERVTVQAVIRRLIKQFLQDERGGTLGS